MGKQDTKKDTPAAAKPSSPPQDTQAKKPAAEQSAAKKPPDAPEAAKPSSPPEDAPVTEDAAQAPSDALVTDTPRGPDDLVVVELRRSIAFGGVAIRPKIETPRGGKADIVTPVRAVVPRHIAESHGEKTCTILADAEAGMKIGQVL